MPHDPKKCLEDLRASAELIGQFRTGRTFQDYDSDPLLRAAIERHFEIIGEAIVRLRKVDATLASQIPEHRRIVSFRNVLIHGYDSINHGEVWDIIENDLPVLHSAVVAMLASLP